MSKLTKKLTAMLLSGILAITSVSGSVFASEIDFDPGQTSEVAVEEATNEVVEISSDAAVEDESMGATVEEAVETPLDAAAEEEVEYYTVTLDANGGYFENEWDDSIGDYAQQAEVINKLVPVGGTVAAYPVCTDQNGQTMVFAGWSLERDGEIVSLTGEEYVPADNCVLYAVLQADMSEDTSWDESAGAENQDYADENTDHGDAIQESENTGATEEPEEESEETEAVEEPEEESGNTEVVEKSDTSQAFEESGAIEKSEVEDAAQEYEDPETAENSYVEEDEASEDNTNPATEDEQIIIPDQEAEYVYEDSNKNIEELSDAAVAEEETQPSMIESSEEEESASEDAAMGVVENGTCGDNLTWTLDHEGTLTISGTGKMTDFIYDSNSHAYNYPWPAEKIKTLLINYGATSIGNCAFYECSYLTNVTIPESVTNIGEWAFYRCKMISVTIPNGVINIGNNAFGRCNSLANVTIPNSVESIGRCAFEGTNLTNVIIPNSVTILNKELFSECAKLTSVTIPNSVTSIGYYVFDNCTNLTSLTIPDSVTTIGDYVFLKSGITSVYFVGNAPSMSKIFSGVTVTAYYPTNNPTWTEDKRQNYGGTVTWVPWDPEDVGFTQSGTCGNNMEWTLDSEGVLTITGRGVMNNYEKESNRYAPWYEYRNDINEVIIDDLVESIGVDAFYDCSNLRNVSIGSKVYSIGSAAFKQCNSLVNIIIPANVSSIGLWAFSYCSNLKSVTICDGVKTIGSQAFFQCSSLDSVVIPDSVTAFGNLTFYKCNNLKSVQIGERTTKIGGSTFSQCTSLSDITIGNVVTAIERGAFSTCRNLKKINLPETIRSIESHAFYNCSSINEFYFFGSFPSIGIDTFEGVTATAYYPANDPTWTEDVRQNYGGNITWVEWDPEADDGIKSLVPSNNAVDVDHSVNPKVVFSEALRLSGYGHIYLYESNNSTPVEMIDAVTSSHAVIIEPMNEEDTSSTLDLFFDTELKPNTKYTISIDSDSLEYLKWDSISQEYVETGNLHTGIEKGVWSFTTASIDYMHFPNQTDEIDESLYYYLFKPGKAFLYSHVWDSSRGKNGTCYGWAYTVGAKRQQYNSINAFRGKLCELKQNSLNINNNYSLLNYIQMAYLYQFSERKLKEDKQNEDKYDWLYQAIKNQINGNGEDIIIAVYEGKEGHALYPVKIISENENEIKVQVLDCNKPDDSYFAELILKKESSIIKGYEYKTYDDHISFDTIDNVLDSAFSDPSRTEQDTTNLVYSPSSLNDSNLNEILPKGDSVSESNLYWTEQNSITQPVMENTTIGMTDGYSLIETNVENAADITIDVSTNTASVETAGDSKVGFSISYTSYDVDGIDNEMTITSETEKGVETQQIEDGIVISSEGNNHVEVSDGDNTVGFETNDASVLVKTDGAITVYEDSNNNGSYTNPVEVTPIGKTKINENNITINYSNDLTFKGNEIKAVDTVAYGNISLDEGTDYTITYIDNINAGTATVTITGIGNYEGTVTKSFTINPAAIDAADISNIELVTYTGTEQTPVPTVKIGDQTLTKDTDYTVSYSNNINIGTATVTITGKRNYAGTVNKTFTISECSITDATVSGISNKTYTGLALTQNPTVKVGDQILTKDTDYTVSYTNNTKVGTATVKMIGKGNYTGTVSKTFKIRGRSIANATVTGFSNKTYTGSTITQNPTVKVGNKILKKGTDYTVSYANNTNVGTATVTITGKGNYASKKTVAFKINKAAQSITAKAKASSVAVGKTTTVSITGNKGKKSYKSSDTTIATVSSTGKVTAKKVGKVTITSTSAATSNYKAASKTVTIKVVPAATTSFTADNQATGIKLTWKKVAGANAYFIYRGSTQIAAIKNGSTVTYTDKKANTNGTKYTYKIVASASSTGRSTLSKSITTYCVARPAISTLTNSAASKMTVKWGKNAKANGYQIQYCPDKTFKTGNKAANITSASTVSKVIGSLAKGKTYYVRIRTFKTVGSTKYFSAWSSVKSVKISK